jgi:hypothetical protein
VLGEYRENRKFTGRPIDKDLGEVLAGTSYAYAEGHIFGTPGPVSGPSLRVDNLQ